MDYKFHLNSRQISALWNDEDEDSDQVPALFEDPDEIDRMIEEEIGTTSRRRRRNRSTY